MCASISGCVGAACWHRKNAVVAIPRWKTLHICQEIVLFSPLSLYHIRAALHDSSGLFSFRKQVRKNLKVLNVQRDIWRIPYLICHRVGYSHSQMFSTLLWLLPPDRYCFPQRVGIYYEHQPPETMSPERLLVWTCWENCSRFEWQRWVEKAAVKVMCGWVSVISLIALIKQTEEYCSPFHLLQYKIKHCMQAIKNQTLSLNWFQVS